MAKRFISPDWKVLRKYNQELQRAWFYIWDKADDSGVYHFDEVYLNVDLAPTKTILINDLASLPDCEILPGERILIKNFLLINNNGILKHGYNPHKPIFRAIEKNGPELFFDLDIKIESGLKDNKIIQAIKLFFKLENKIFKLVDEGVDEGEEEDKGGAGGIFGMPQKIDDPKMWESEKQSFLNSGPWIFKFCTDKTLKVDRFDELANEFISDLELKEDFKVLKEIRSHFTNWYNLKKQNGKLVKIEPLSSKIKLK